MAQRDDGSAETPMTVADSGVDGHQVEDMSGVETSVSSLFHTGLRVPILKTFYERITKLTTLQPTSRTDFLPTDTSLAIDMCRPAVQSRVELSQTSTRLVATDDFVLHLRAGLCGAVGPMHSGDPSKNNRLEFGTLPYHIFGQADYIRKRDVLLTPLGEEYLSISTIPYTKTLLSVSSNLSADPMISPKALGVINVLLNSLLTTRSSEPVALLLRIAWLASMLIGTGSGKISYNCDLYNNWLPTYTLGDTHGFTTNPSVSLITLSDYYENFEEYSKTYSNQPKSPGQVLFCNSRWIAEYWFVMIILAIFPWPVCIPHVQDCTDILMLYNAEGHVTDPHFDEPGSYYSFLGLTQLPGVEKLLLVCVDNPENVLTTDNTSITLPTKNQTFSTIFPYLSVGKAWEPVDYLPALDRAWSFVASMIGDTETVQTVIKLLGPIIVRYYPMGVSLIPANVSSQYTPETITQNYGFCSHTSRETNQNIWDRSFAPSNEFVQYTSHSVTLPLGHCWDNDITFNNIGTAVKRVFTSSIVSLPILNLDPFNGVVTEIIEPVHRQNEIPTHLHLLNVLHKAVIFSHGLAAVTDFIYWLSGFRMQDIYQSKTVDTITLDNQNSAITLLKNFLSYDETGYLYVMSNFATYRFIKQVPTYTWAEKFSTYLCSAQRLPYPMLQYYLGLRTNTHPTSDHFLSRRSLFERVYRVSSGGSILFDNIAIRGPSFEAIRDNPDLFDTWYLDTQGCLLATGTQTSFSTSIALYSQNDEKPFLPFVQATLGYAYLIYSLFEDPPGPTGGSVTLPATLTRYIPNLSLPPILAQTRMAPSSNMVVAIGNWNPLSGPSWITTISSLILRDMIQTLKREVMMAKHVGDVGTIFQ